MKQTLLDLFGIVFVERLSIIAQLAILVAASASFYEARSHSSVSRLLSRIATLERYAWFGKYGFGVGNRPPEPAIENFHPRYVFASALAIALLVVASHESLPYWLAFPFAQAAKALTIWRTFEWEWFALLLPFRSAGYLIWFLVTMFLIYGLGVAIFVRAIALASVWVHKHLSEASFHALLFGVSVIAGLLLIAATTEWFPTP